LASLFVLCCLKPPPNNEFYVGSMQEDSMIDNDADDDPELPELEDKV